jgi:hypothetical protein
MRQDRFLIGILAGIGGLILIALLLFFLRPGHSSYVDDTTPSGVVNNYVLALQRHDYQRAYSYLAQGSSRPSYVNFQQPFLTYQANEISNTPVEIGKDVDDQSSSVLVQITLVRGGQGFLQDVYRDVQTAQLIQQDGVWKIASFPYPYWAYEWSIEITPEVQPTNPSTAP